MIFSVNSGPWRDLLLYAGSFCSVRSSIDDSIRMCFFSSAQVSDDFIEIVVVFSGVCVAVAPDFCNYFVSVHFRLPPTVIPGGYKSPDNCILQQHIWILELVFVRHCQYVDNSRSIDSPLRVHRL